MLLKYVLKNYNISMCNYNMFIYSYMMENLFVWDFDKNYIKY